MYCIVRNPALTLQWIFNKAIYLSIYVQYTYQRAMKPVPQMGATISVKLK